MIRVYYSPEYTCSGYAFETTRKARWVADSLIAAPIAGLEVAVPEPLTRKQVSEVHALEYVRAIETGQPRGLAESQGFSWDERLWPMVLASNGGAVAAALTALKEGVSGSLSSGLHHARHGRGEGFCTFNGLVIAARAALAAGARSVLILDLDAHCGGGTASLIAGVPGIWQIDVSVNRFDRYEDSDSAWLRLVDSGADYLPAIQKLLGDADRRDLRFDLCLYNAGMDPCETCSTGGLRGITPAILAERERLVFAWCRQRHLPVAFVLAGGYLGPRLSERELVELHRSTLAAAASCGRSAVPR